MAPGYPVLSAAKSGEGVAIVDDDGTSCAVTGIRAGDGVIFDTSISGEVVVKNLSPATSVTLATASCEDCDASFVAGGAGPDLSVKALRVGDGLALDTSIPGVVKITIDAPTPAVLTTAGGDGDVSLVADDGEGSLALKALRAGDGVALDTSVPGVVKITNIAPATPVALSTAGEDGDASLVDDAGGLALKALRVGEGLSLDTSTPGVIVLTNTAPAVAVDPPVLASAGGEGDTSLIDGDAGGLTLKALRVGEGLTLDTTIPGVIVLAATAPGVAADPPVLASSGGEGDATLVDGDAGGLTLKALRVGEGLALDTSIPGVVRITNTAPAVPAEPPSLATAGGGGATSLVYDATALALKALRPGAGMSLDLSTPGEIGIVNTSPATSVSLASAGGAASLVAAGVGPALAVKGLRAGAGMALDTSISGEIVVSNIAPAVDIVLTSAGGTVSLVADGAGPSLAVKGLRAGAGMAFDTSVPGEVGISNASPATAVTLATAGGDTSLVAAGAGPALGVRGLVAGAGIALSVAGGAVTIAATGGGGGSGGGDGEPWVVRDVKPAGAVGGSYITPDSWVRRVLNSLTGNAAADVQLAAAPAGTDQLLIAAGTYRLSGYATGAGIGAHRVRLRNVTDGVDVLYGSSAITRSTAISAPSFFEGTFTVAGGAKVFEIQHVGTDRQGDTGFGMPSGYVSEIYLAVAFTKLS